MQDGELLALREYVETLQRENQAKTIEQQTLYRELQALDAEVKIMERYYYRNREMNKEIEQLRSALNNQSHFLMQAEQRENQINYLREEIRTLQENANISNETLSELQALSQNQANRIQRLEQDITSLTHQNTLMKRKREEMSAALQEKQDEIHALRQKLYEFSQDQRSQTQRNLQQLAQNYEKIELIVLQKQEQIRQMQSYIGQLQQQCEFLNQQYIKSQRHIRKLQYDIKTLQMRRPSRQVPEDNLSFLTDSISKVELMRQNNRMLERIVRYEKENREEEGNGSQRCSYSQCGEGKKNNSPSKLQMRIHTLKVENEHLLRTLAI